MNSLVQITKEVGKAFLLMEDTGEKQTVTRPIGVATTNEQAAKDWLEQPHKGFREYIVISLVEKVL